MNSTTLKKNWYYDGSVGGFVPDPDGWLTGSKFRVAADSPNQPTVYGVAAGETVKFEIDIECSNFLLDMSVYSVSTNNVTGRSELGGTEGARIKVGKYCQFIEDIEYMTYGQHIYGKSGCPFTLQAGYQSSTGYWDDQESIQTARAKRFIFGEVDVYGYSVAIASEYPTYGTINEVYTNPDMPTGSNQYVSPVIYNSWYLENACPTYATSAGARTVEVTIYGGVDGININYTRIHSGSSHAFRAYPNSFQKPLEMAFICESASSSVKTSSPQPAGTWNVYGYNLGLESTLTVNASVSDTRSGGAWTLCYDDHLAFRAGYVLNPRVYDGVNGAITGAYAESIEADKTASAAETTLASDAVTQMINYPEFWDHSTKLIDPARFYYREPEWEPVLTFSQTADFGTVNYYVDPLSCYQQASSPATLSKRPLHLGAVNLNYSTYPWGANPPTWISSTSTWNYVADNNRSLYSSYDFDCGDLMTSENELIRDVGATYSFPTRANVAPLLTTRIPSKTNAVDSLYQSALQSSPEGSTFTINQQTYGTYDTINVKRIFSGVDFGYTDTTTEVFGSGSWVEGIENDTVTGEPWWSRSFINSSHCYIERETLRGFMPPIKDGTFEILEGVYNSNSITPTTADDCLFEFGFMTNNLTDCGKEINYNSNRYRYARNVCMINGTDNGSPKKWYIGFPDAFDNYPNIRLYDDDTNYIEFDATGLYSQFANSRHDKIGKFDITFDSIVSAVGSYDVDDYVKLRVRL